MLVLPRIVHDLCHLGLRDLIGKDTTFSYSMIMHMKHYACSVFSVLLEKPFQNMNDEFHGSVIVIEKQHAIKAGFFEFGFRPGNDSRSPAVT